MSQSSFSKKFKGSFNNGRNRGRGGRGNGSKLKINCDILTSSSPSSSTPISSNYSTPTSPISSSPTGMMGWFPQTIMSSPIQSSSAKFLPPKPVFARSDNKENRQGGFKQSNGNSPTDVSREMNFDGLLEAIQFDDIASNNEDYDIQDINIQEDEFQEEDKMDTSEPQAFTYPSYTTLKNNITISSPELQSSPDIINRFTQPSNKDKIVQDYFAQIDKSQSLDVLYLFNNQTSFMMMENITDFQEERKFIDFTATTNSWKSKIIKALKTYPLAANSFKTLPREIIHPSASLNDFLKTQYKYRELEVVNYRGEPKKIKGCTAHYTRNAKNQILHLFHLDLITIIKNSDDEGNINESLISATYPKYICKMIKKIAAREIERINLDQQYDDMKRKMFDKQSNNNYNNNNHNNNNKNYNGFQNKVDQLTTNFNRYQFLGTETSPEEQAYTNYVEMDIDTDIDPPTQQYRSNKKNNSKPKAKNPFFLADQFSLEKKTSVNRDQSTHNKKIQLQKTINEQICEADKKYNQQQYEQQFQNRYQNQHQYQYDTYMETQEVEDVQDVEMTTEESYTQTYKHQDSSYTQEIPTQKFTFSYQHPVPVSRKRKINEIDNGFTKFQTYPSKKVIKNGQNFKKRKLIPVDLGAERLQQVIKKRDLQRKQMMNDQFFRKRIRIKNNRESQQDHDHFLLFNMAIHSMKIHQAEQSSQVNQAYQAKEVHTIESDNPLKEVHPINLINQDNQIVNESITEDLELEKEELQKKFSKLNKGASNKEIKEAVTKMIRQKQMKRYYEREQRDSQITPDPVVAHWEEVFKIIDEMEVPPSPVPDGILKKKAFKGRKVRFNDSRYIRSFRKRDLYDNGFDSEMKY
ncbi:hypothetical protein B5S33_g2371 [[Candida] boidinii]|nr:hypothetical protein B5S33_g2371 [[Candida] boidinii]